MTSTPWELQRNPASNRRRQIRDELIGRQKNYCFYCLRPTSPDLPQSHPLFRTMDHIVPHTWGGGWHIDNMVLACQECNLYWGHSIVGKDGIVDECAERLSQWLAFDPCI